MSDWAFLNRHRVREGLFRTGDDAGFNGLFVFAVAGEARLVKAVASDGLGWRHVSVSFQGSAKPPSWAVMDAVCRLFYEPDEWVVQFHAPPARNVNNYPGTLHLWSCVGREFPVPDPKQVGVPGVELGAPPKPGREFTARVAAVAGKLVAASQGLLDSRCEWPGCGEPAAVRCVEFDQKPVCLAHRQAAELAFRQRLGAAYKVAGGRA